MSYAATPHTTKVPLSSASKLLYTKEDLLNLTDQPRQTTKSELDQLFDELPKVPRYVDNESEAVRSTKSDMLKIKTAPSATLTKPITVATLSEQMHKLTIPKPTTSKKPSEEIKLTSTIGINSKLVTQKPIAFPPSAPPLPQCDRLSTYSFIPTGSARFENVRPPPLSEEYRRQPAFFDQIPIWEEPWPQPKPKEEPQPKPKPKKGCIIS